MSTYLSICAIYLDEAPYLREWIEFHRLVGVERFFLYDHESSDEHRQVLAPYLEEGVVEVHEWPPPQRAAYDHCLAERRDESRWIAFIDTDEFLFSPALRPLPEVLRQFEQWPGVGVNRLTFGTSGHIAMPDGLVIENYVMTYPMGASIKSIVDPRHAERSRNPHSFVYRDNRFAVDEHKRPIDGWFTTEFTHSLLQINHYYTKSEAEFRHKLAEERADNGQLREPPKNFAKLGGTEREDSITAYVPRLREALERRGQTGTPLR